MRSIHSCTFVITALLSAPVLAQPATAPTQPATAPATRAVMGAARDADAPMTFEQMREEARKEVERSTGSQPLLGTFSVREVLEFRLDGQNHILELRTPMAKTGGSRRVQLKDLPGIVTLQVQGKQQQGIAEVPQGLQFFHYNLDAPRAVMIKTTILAQPNYLAIFRDSVLEDRTVTTQYIQAWHVAARGENGVRLYVRGLDRSNETIVDVRVSAADFTELRHRYPREVAEYLQPIFRDLHQEGAIVAIDTRLGWQVFAEEWQPDPATADKVKVLVADLNADSFAKRQAAGAELEKLGQPAALLLMRTSRTRWTDEQNSRADAFLAAYQPIPAEEARRLKASPDFLLDCLYSDDAGLRTVAVAQLQKVLGRKVEFDVQADAAGRFRRVAELRSSLLPPPASRSATPEESDH